MHPVGIFFALTSLLLLPAPDAQRWRGAAARCRRCRSHSRHARHPPGHHRPRLNAAPWLASAPRRQQEGRGAATARHPGRRRCALRWGTRGGR
nr:MAG TPA: hypothetical protein [Bacteriophage sp.]DAO57395.1 MAG TPA: hypothetical protein [Caudoviricetes sp.]